MRLTKLQTAAAQADLSTTVFLEGRAGTGKTTAGVRRVRHLLEAGVPAESILVLVPQQALAFPYRDELRRGKKKAGGLVTIATIGSLAQRVVNLFWPLVSELAGFDNPRQPPRFLGLELVQYYMTRVVGPVIDHNDYFNSVRIDRSRLYSQIVDNLNKAAVVGFPHTEIGQRLTAAWQGEITQQYIYQDAQDCANHFRDFCKRHSLLDFSFQVELFIEHLWPLDSARGYLTRQYRHLIVDNAEEDNPATHAVVSEWLGLCQSALVIYDQDAGYRRFLGADPTDGYRLKKLCREPIELDRTYVMSPEVAALEGELRAVFQGASVKRSKKTDPRAALVHTDNRYYPQMIGWTADHIAALVHNQGVPPGEIVVLAPLLSDALRFSLMNRLETLGVPARSHRPSRALRDEPAARALLTWARIVHPEWRLPAESFDVTFALMEAIADLDLTRARLLTEMKYQRHELKPFEPVREEMQIRIGYDLGGRYQRLYDWLAEYQRGERLPLDVFFSRLFGELLAQPGFGFHGRYDAARVAANLIDSARAFRRTVADIEPETDTGREYAEMVEMGVIASQYVRDWELNDTSAVLLAPAYTFLMSNRPVDYQFWLNVGSASWGQRLYQPLTHPYVLSLQWPEDQVWTDDDEYKANQDALYRLVSGLARRCRKQIFLGYSQFGEQGYEQRGPLLDAIQRLLKRLVTTEGGDV